MNRDIPARGRPGSPEAHRAILSAALGLLAERGLAAMSIEEVAARAGVGKATIYRRWPSKGLLALDAFVTSFREQQPLPDTGTLRGDLLFALDTWVRAVTQTPMGPMLTGLIAEAQHDPELRGAWRDRVLEPLRTQHRIMLDRAMVRGEIPESVDREVVLDLFFGAAEHRLLLGHLPMTEAFIGDVVDVILGGIALLAQFQLGLVSWASASISSWASASISSWASASISSWASASISTSQAGSSRPATITAVAAGRVSAKTSPCARATSRQWLASVR
jgi:AcrR family transcriptional regulator